MKDGSGRIVGDHSVDIYHLMDVQVYQRYKFRKFAKKEIDKNDEITTKMIVAKFINEEMIHVDPTMPSDRYCSNQVTQLKEEKMGKIITKFEELDIELLKQKFPNFVRDQLFYLEKGVQKRIIVLYSDFQLNLLKRSELSLLGDGTFKYVPSLFSQQYTIHQTIGSTAIPVIYFFTQSKTEEMYTCLFQYLRDVLKCDIQEFKTDFELAPRNSIVMAFPNIKIGNCWFHFNQALLYHIRDVGLIKEYSSVLKVNLLIRYYMSLPFIYIEEMDLFINIIVSEIEKIENIEIRDKMNKFHDYFVNTWMGKIYKVEDWNQCSQLLRRSNNWCEQWHSAVSHLFSVFKTSFMNVVITGQLSC